MNLRLGFLDNIKNKELWGDVAFYIALAVAVCIAVFYGVLAFKVYFYNTKIAEIRDKTAMYSSSEEKANEEIAFNYKKKIDDFATLISNHRISSQVFSFMEDNTLAGVSFLGINMASNSNDIRLSGSAKDMETISRQFRIFETSKEYISNVSVLNTVISPLGTISFTMNFSFDPKIFTYAAPVAATVLEVPPAPPVNN